MIYRIPEMRTDVAFLTLLLSSGLICIGKTAIDVTSDVTPNEYNVQLISDAKDLDINKFSFEGRVKITIRIHKSMRNISFHVQPNIKVLDSTLIELNQKLNKTIKPLHHSYYETSFSRFIFTLHFNTTLLPILHILEMKFISTYNDKTDFFKTFYRNEKGNKVQSIVTHFHALGARGLFPCWDLPNKKAIFTISVKHHVNYTVLSNMPIRRTIFLENNMIWKYFNSTPLIAPYLVGIVMTTNFDVHNATCTGQECVRDFQIFNVWYRQHSPENIKFARMLATKVLRYLNDTEMPYQNDLQKVDHLVIPGFEYDSIQNYGFISYREADIIYNKELDPAAQKIKIQRLVGRELAHQYYGNQMSSSSWSELWLNDAIAVFFGTDAINKMQNAQMWDLFVVQYVHESLHLDTYLNLTLIQDVDSFSERNSLTYFSRYIKAPVILRMLQHIVSNYVFAKSIQRYFNDYKHSSSNATAFSVTMKNELDKIIKANIIVDKSYLKGIRMENKSDKILDKPHWTKLRMNITQILSTWTMQPHSPVLNVKFEDYKNVTVWLENIKALDYKNWWIPLTFTTQTECNFYKIFHIHGKWLRINREHSHKFPLRHNETGWIIFNLQQIGYYRVNYDLRNWQCIANYLNSQQYAKIHVLNRAQLIDDAFHLAKAEKLDTSIFWKLANYLRQETNYIPWYPLFKALEYMSTVFSFPEARVKQIKRNIRYILKEVLNKIGYDENSDDNDLIKCLRQEAAKWACIVDLSQCKRIAQRKLLQYLKTPEIHKPFATDILPWWKDWTYCNGLRTQSNDISWPNIYKMLRQKFDVKMFESLACSESPTVIHLSLMILRTDIAMNITLQSIDRINYYLLIIARHARNNLTLKYILRNFKLIKPTEISMPVVLTHIINHVYSKKQLREIKGILKKGIVKKEKLLSRYVSQKIQVRRDQIVKKKCHLMKL